MSARLEAMITTGEISIFTLDAGPTMTNDFEVSLHCGDCGKTVLTEIAIDLNQLLEAVEAHLEENP